MVTIGTTFCVLLLLCIECQAFSNHESIPPSEKTIEGERVVKASASSELHPKLLTLKVATPDAGEANIQLERRDAMADTQLESHKRKRRNISKRNYDHHGHYVNKKKSAVISSRLVKKHNQMKKEYHGHFSHKKSMYQIDATNEGHRVTRVGDTYEATEKRSVGKTENVLEYCAVVDYTIFIDEMRKQGDDRAKAIEALRYRYTHFFNGIDIIYRSVPELALSLRVAKFVIQEDVESSKWTMAGLVSGDTANAKDLVVESSRVFSAKTGMPKSGSENPEFKCDHIALYTKADILNQGYKALGVSPVANRGNKDGVCRVHPVSVNQDLDLHSWLTAAHELAHNLGSVHDGQPNSEGALCRDGVNLMGASPGRYTMTTLKNAFQFSECTKNQILGYIKFLDSEEKNCMKVQNNPNTDMPMDRSKIGKMYTSDEVCKLQGHPGACKDYEDDPWELKRICYQLLCANQYGNCIVSKMGNGANLRALPGTKCGDKMECDWNGQCVEEVETPKFKPVPTPETIPDKTIQENKCDLDEWGTDDCTYYYGDLKFADPCMCLNTADMFVSCCVTAAKICAALPKAPPREVSADQAGCTEADDYKEWCGYAREDMNTGTPGQQACVKNDQCLKDTEFSKNCCQKNICA